MEDDSDDSSESPPDPRRRITHNHTLNSLNSMEDESSESPQDPRRTQIMLHLLSGKTRTVQAGELTDMNYILGEALMLANATIAPHLTFYIRDVVLIWNEERLFNKINQTHDDDNIYHLTGQHCFLDFLRRQHCDDKADTDLYVSIRTGAQPTVIQCFRCRSTCIHRREMHYTVRHAWACEWCISYL